MLTLNDGRSELWQWDTNRKLTVDADCSQVHFSNKVFGRSIDVDVIDGVAIIPDILLQTDKDLNVWAFVGTAENGYTKISKTFKVNRRNKPADYVFTPPDQTSLEEIKEKVEYLESVQDPDAIKNAVDDYLANNPIMVKETDPTVPEWAKQPTPPDVKIPDKLPNPHSITFTGAVDASYDGSNPVEIKIPDSGGNVDLTGYATEQYVKDYAQPKGEYLTEVPDGYAKTVDIPTKPEDIGAQPAGNYLTEVPSGYATEEFVKNKIAEAELGGEEVDLSGYAKISDLPTKTSQLTNDSGFITKAPVESVNGHTGEVKLTAEDVGAISQDDLQEATNEALAQAKASGEFDGPQGPKGDTGEIGPAGPTGETGPEGPQGERGPQGEKGEPGEKGDKGDKGDQGVQGEQGIQGIPGEKGEKGDTGAPGADGAKGDKGDKGDTGATGAQGEPGKDGADGKDGTSATHSWNGTVLTITSASGTSSADLKGDKGDKGDPGEPGVDGADYILTDADKTEIAEMAAELVEIPDSSQNVELDTTLTQSGKAADAKAVGDALDTKIPIPQTATVGQVISVKAVDDEGKPTEWEPVDLPSGVGGGYPETFDITTLATGTISTGTNGGVDTGLTYADFKDYDWFEICIYGAAASKGKWGFAERQSPEVWRRFNFCDGRGKILLKKITKTIYTGQWCTGSITPTKPADYDRYAQDSSTLCRSLFRIDWSDDTKLYLVNTEETTADMTFAVSGYKFN